MVTLRQLSTVILVSPLRIIHNVEHRLGINLRRLHFRLLYLLPATCLFVAEPGPGCLCPHFPFPLVRLKFKMNNQVGCRTVFSMQLQPNAKVCLQMPSQASGYFTIYSCERTAKPAPLRPPPVRPPAYMPAPLAGPLAIAPCLLPTSGVQSFQPIAPLKPQQPLLAQHVNFINSERQPQPDLHFKLQPQPLVPIAVKRQTVVLQAREVAPAPQVSTLLKPVQTAISNQSQNLRQIDQIDLKSILEPGVLSAQITMVKRPPQVVLSAVTQKEEEEQVLRQFKSRRESVTPAATLVREMVTTSRSESKEKSKFNNSVYLLRGSSSSRLGRCQSQRGPSLERRRFEGLARRTCFLLE